MNRTHPQESLTSSIGSPGFIVALLLLLLNDHLLKHHFPGLVTGKLSDFAGLFLVSLLAASLRRISPLSALLLLALLFVWWKSPASTAAITAWNTFDLWPLQRVVDYSDLVALASLPAAFAYRRRCRTLPLSALLRLPLIMATLFAVSATSMIPHSIKLQIPHPQRATAQSQGNPFCNSRLLRDLDEEIRALGYLPEEANKAIAGGNCQDELPGSYQKFYRASQGESYLTVEYDPHLQVVDLQAADYYDVEFRRGAERLRLALREALIRRGYFPLEGGVVIQQPPTSYTRLQITPAPDADPLTALYAYDFRRLSYRLDDLLTKRGFTAVERPDCGNNAFYGAERICSQYLAGLGAAEGEVALTSVSLVGYMLPGQPPIEISVVQFGAHAPFAAPTLGRALQAALQQAIPELAIQVVTTVEQRPAPGQ